MTHPIDKEMTAGGLTISDVLEAKIGNKPKKRVVGRPPNICDICGDDMKFHYPDEPMVCYDFKTPRGPWAWGCASCFRELGGQLGTGRGQKFVYNEEDKAWYKEEG